MDVPPRQNPQPQQMRQKPCVSVIVRLLEALVLLCLCRIGQPHRIAVRLQSVHQPVPVVRRFHRHGFQSLANGPQCPPHQRQIIWQTPAKQQPVLTTGHRVHGIVGMQIDSTI